MPRNSISCTSHGYQPAVVLAILFAGAIASDLQAQGNTLAPSGARSRSVTSQASAAAWTNSNWLSPDRNNKWRLGVLGEHTDIGVIVKEVQPGSAADRARIEPNDIIIVVGGYQVGIVEGRLYNLDEEINLRASDSGVVGMVVQDHRSLGLAHIHVQLDEAQKTLRGRLVLQQATSLPPDAIITVQIENLTRPYYQVRNGQVRLRPTGQTTIPFEIAYDPAYIYPQDQYQVRAFVTAGGRTLMDTPRPVRVFSANSPREITLELAPLNTSLTSTGSGNVIKAGYPNFQTIDEQITAMYRHYLKRDPTLLELAALRTIPGIEQKLRDLPLELMASQEFYDAAGNNNSVWLDRVFEEIVKRPPSTQEHEQWMRRFAELRYSRMELLRQLYAQANKTTGSGQ